MGKDLKDLTIATLQKDKVETIALDIYINVSQNVTLSISGAGELHLSGFFEPQRDEMDENMFLDEEDEEEDEEEEVVAGGKISQNLKQAKANALKNAKGGAPVADSDDDEDEEDEDEDEEDEDEDEDSEDVPPQKAV
jgi:hypothetical protein